MPFTFPSLQNPNSPNTGPQSGPGDTFPQDPRSNYYGPQGPRGPRGFVPGTQMGSANPGPVNWPSYMSPSNWSLPSMFGGEGLWKGAGGMVGGAMGGLPGMFIGRYLAGQANDMLGGGQQPDTPWYQGASGRQAVIDANQAPSGEYEAQPIGWGTPDNSGRYILQEDGTLVDTQTGASYQDVGGEWRRQTSMGTYRGDSGFVTGVMGNIPMMNPVGGNQEQVDMATQRMRQQMA